MEGPRRSRPGTIPEDISKLEWRLWQTRFEIYVKASTEGGNPSEALRQTSLQSKLDAFWHERILLAYSRDIAVLGDNICTLKSLPMFHCLETEALFLKQIYLHRPLFMLYLIFIKKPNTSYNKSNIN